ncbi:MAG: glycosyltransferase family 4 protein [Bacilli bacterium]
MMNLLIVTIDDFPHRGGKSTHISNLIAGLKYQNVKCTVFDGKNINSLEFSLLKCIIYPFKFFSKKKYLFYRKKIQIFLFKKSLFKYTKNKKFDVISFQDAITCGSCGYKYKNNFLTMHTYFGIEYTLDSSGFTLEDPYYKKLLSIEENSLKNTNAIICVDNRIKEHISNRMDEYKFKIPIYSIPNFTNTDFFTMKKAKHKDFTIACVRRLVEKNGVIYAVKAMEYLQQYNCYLLIYGEGPCYKEINHYIYKHGLESKVKLMGGIDNSKLPQIYNKCDAVVVPSITINGLQEATSISAIESMACGIPTIASNIGGLPILIKDKKTGFLVEEQTPEKIANIIKFLMNNPKEANNIGKSGRKYIIENYSHIKAAKEYYDIFMGNIE